jgi:hypothetical protein
MAEDLFYLYHYSPEGDTFLEPGRSRPPYRLLFLIQRLAAVPDTTMTTATASNSGLVIWIPPPLGFATPEAVLVEVESAFELLAFCVEVWEDEVVAMPRREPVFAVVVVEEFWVTVEKRDVEFVVNAKTPPYVVP